MINTEMKRFTLQFFWCLHVPGYKVFRSFDVMQVKHNPIYFVWHTFIEANSTALLIPGAFSARMYYSGM